MEETDLLCDSSSLISLTDSCLDHVLYFLNGKFRIKFVIPASVEQETVERPLTSHLKQYAFSALKIKKAVADKVICRVGHENGAVEKRTEEVLRLANNMFFVKGTPIRLVHLGEAEVLALAKELDISSILIDERTTRMLIEAPFPLKEHLEKEFHVHIMVNRTNLSAFTDLVKGIEVIRSAELAILAFENGFFDDFKSLKRDTLEAALYKLKLTGCSIRFDEIEEYVRSLGGMDAAVPGK